MANPALAQTTLFCASVPFPEIIVSKILVASSTVFPPKIALGDIFLSPKLLGENINYEWFEAIFALFVSDNSS